MGLNDATRSRKTYSFFRSPPQPVNQATTVISGGYGINISGNQEQIIISVDPDAISSSGGGGGYTTIQDSAGNPVAEEDTFRAIGLEVSAQAGYTNVSLVATPKVYRVCATSSFAAGWTGAADNPYPESELTTLLASLVSEAAGPYLLEFAPGSYGGITVTTDGQNQVVLRGLHAGSELTAFWGAGHQFASISIDNTTCDGRLVLEGLRITGNLDIGAATSGADTVLIDCVIFGNVTKSGAAGAGDRRLLIKNSKIYGSIDSDISVRDLSDGSNVWRYDSAWSGFLTGVNLSDYAAQYKVCGEDIELRIAMSVDGAVSGTATIGPPPGYEFGDSLSIAVHGAFIDLVRCPSSTLPSTAGSTSASVIGQKSSSTAIDFIWPTAFATTLSSGDQVFVRVSYPWTPG